jgi:hypothetical protein
MEQQSARYSFVGCTVAYFIFFAGAGFFFWHGFFPGDFICVVLFMLEGCHLAEVCWRASENSLDNPKRSGHNNRRHANNHI